MPVIRSSVALQETTIDPASFTLFRLGAGALALALILRVRGHRPAPPLRPIAGRQLAIRPRALRLRRGLFFRLPHTLRRHRGAAPLRRRPATMIFWGLRRGERRRPWQLGGMALALGGLVALVLPGLSAPPLVGSALMLGAGVAWGVYSLRGKAAGDPAGGILLLGEPLTWRFLGASGAILGGIALVILRLESRATSR